MKGGTKPYESQALTELIKALSALNSDGKGLRPKYLAKLNKLFEESKHSEGQRTDEFSTKLKGLESELSALAQAEVKAAMGGSSDFIWSTSPKIYLEILFWALFGTLVRLIFVVHQYLRWNRFFKQGMYQHIALLITVPILTLVFVAVISMAKLTAEDASVVLDFSDPRIVAGGSFLIALVPWQLWERLLGTARKVVGAKDENG